jgi:3',5'-cyclic AMP phosphodiesterase CpdA
MRRLVWLTDIHLDFLNRRGIERFCRRVVAVRPDAVLIGGDISVPSSIRADLTTLGRCLDRPIYFVLGNHDFFGASIEYVRSIVEAQSEASPWLNWLPATGIVELTESTGLIGHDGWADGRLGNGANSHVELNDYLHIADFSGLGRKDRFELLNTLGDRAADYFRDVLPSALSHFRNLLLLTHVPPFRESCWHEGSISNDEYLPHFACRSVGDVLSDVMQRYPEHNLTVLCGHTHSGGETEIAPNLLAKTGWATYGRPEVQEVIVVE